MIPRIKDRNKHQDIEVVRIEKLPPMSDVCEKCGTMENLRHISGYVVCRDCLASWLDDGLGIDRSEYRSLDEPEGLTE